MTAAAAYAPFRPTASPLPPGLLLAALLAATIPTLLAYHQPPSATLLNQCLAVAGWGAVAAVLAPARIGGSTGALLAALALVAIAAAASSSLGSLPASLAWQAIGLLAAAGAVDSPWSLAGLAIGYALVMNSTYAMRTWTLSTS